MPLFIDNTGQARAPGVYAVEVTPPRVIDEVSQGYIGFVGQFAWGPKQSVYTPADSADFINTFEPAGSPRTSSGYYAVMRRRGFTAKFVRVLGSGSAAAVATITGTGGNQVATAKYHGTLGNSITVTYAAASGGDAAKRDVTVQLVNAVTGSTVEVYRDQSLPAPSAAGSIDVSASKLLASFTIAAHGTPAWPSNGTTSLSTGSNGAALTAADYTGTIGTANAGVALFETHDDVRVVCHDECGTSIRAATILGFVAHATSLRDRIAVVDAASDSADWASVKSQRVSGLQSDYCVYNGAWVKVYDEAGVSQVSPLSTMVASAILNLEPQQSHAWRDPTATRYYDGVVSIHATFSTKSPTIQGEAKEQGINLPIQTASGKFASLHDRHAAASGFTITRRIKNFLALSLLPPLDPYTNGPNVVEQNLEIKVAVDNFVQEQVRKGRLIQASTDINTVNNDITMALGEFYIALDAKSPAAREKIFLLVNVGPTVTVREAA